MSSSNSFNICPRCGNSNSLNAKYCSRCGAQLKVPTEAVVCHKCHTRNSSLANFCRNCGATLKVGAQTKICPRCGREIGAEENMCACGYSFVTLQQTEPRRADVSSTNRDKKKDKKHDKPQHVERTYNEPAPKASSGKSEKKPKAKKGGRGFALFAFIILALFVYAVIAPVDARPEFLTNLDQGFYHHAKDVTAEPPADGGDNNGQQSNEGDAQASLTYDVATPLWADDDGSGAGQTADQTGNTENADNTNNQPAADDGEQTYIYGWSLISELIDLFTNEAHKAAMSSYEGGAFNYIIEQLGWATFLMMAMLALFLVTAVLHLLVCLLRIISPKRSRKANLLYMILAVVTTLLTAMMLCAHFLPEGENFIGQVREFFVPKFNGVTCSYGYALIFIPVYYWFFWLYSHVAKKKPSKKSNKDE